MEFEFAGSSDSRFVIRSSNRRGGRSYNYNLFARLRLYCDQAGNCGAVALRHNRPYEYVYRNDIDAELHNNRGYMDK